MRRDGRPSRRRGIFEMDWRCAICRVCTCDLDEYYMVQNALWEEAARALRGNPHAPGIHGGLFLCVGCLEARIGRRLGPADFLDVPCNDWPTTSDRLADRRGQKKGAFS